MLTVKRTERNRLTTGAVSVSFLRGIGVTSNSYDTIIIIRMLLVVNHSHIMINPVNIHNGKMMETDAASLKPFCDYVEKITGERNRLKFKNNDE